MGFMFSNPAKNLSLTEGEVEWPKTCLGHSGEGDLSKSHLTRHAYANASACHPLPQWRKGLNRTCFAALLFTLTFLFTTHANAASAVGTPHVQIHLLADKTAVAPGDTVTIALDQDILPTWHLYWRNPGDSGIAPSMAWTLPPGYTIGAIGWAPPSRLAFGPLVNFGYSNHVVLLTDVKVPGNAVIGNPAKLTTVMSWLVCQETCIPENATLDISVPVEAESQIDPAQVDLFFRTRNAIPQPASFPATLESDSKVLTLTIHAPPPAQAFYFPYKAGLIDDSAPQVIAPLDEGKAYALQLARGELRQKVTSLEGVLETYDDAGHMQQAYTLTADSEAAPQALPAQPTMPVLPVGKPALLSLSVWSALALALAGGVILNLMPCVFPVLSLKILALARHAHDPDSHAKESGISYTAGVLVSFIVIGVILLALRAAGSAIGWGFQLQSPPFVLCLTYLLFVMGLSLSGFFTLSGSFVNLGAGLAASEGRIGSFFTGALAALVATPCSAPFMGPAIGFALTQSWPVALAIIECLGLGLALPYLVLTFNPRLVRLMPRPGAWMERLKQFLAFPLYASAIWLLWVLSLQVGPNGTLAALCGVLILCFALWCFTISRAMMHRLWQRLFTALAVLSLFIVASFFMSPLLQPQLSQNTDSASFIPEGWESFSPSRLADLQNHDTPVFVDMSAAWCITCIVNEKVALGPDMTQTLTAKGIALLKGDWTNQDPQITALLASFGRSGVPLYVYYPAGHKPPVVLPQILNHQIVLDTIEP